MAALEGRDLEKRLQGLGSVPTLMYVLWPCPSAAAPPKCVPWPENVERLRLSFGVPFGVDKLDRTLPIVPYLSSD